MDGTRTANKVTGPALFSVVYFLVVSLTISTTRFEGGLALVWFGTAVAACWLTTIERKDWWRWLIAMVPASMLATVLFGLGPQLAVPLAITNVFESWLTAQLLLAARPQRDWLGTIGGLAVLMVVCGIIAPASAGAFGAIAVTTVVPGDLSHHFLSWVTAHSLGTVIGFPIAHFVISYLGSEAKREYNRAKAAECLGHAVAVAVISVIAFAVHPLPLLFLPVVPVLFASFRCGRGGSALAIVIVGMVGVWSVDTGASVIATLPLALAGKSIFLQFYLATLTAIAVPCSVALHQHREVLRELAYRKAVKRLIAEHSDDALVNLDENGRIRFASRAGERFSGIEDLAGRTLDVFFDPLDQTLVADALEQARMNPDETIVIERPVIRGDEEMWLEAKLRTAVSHSDGLVLRGFAVTIRDVTDHKNIEFDAIHEAETDVLTQLPNRRVVLRQLERALAHAPQRPLALAIIDLDHFKGINDTHGHVAGDEVLRAVAKVMHGYVSPTRVFARLGGEEFALVDLQPDFAASAALCEDLRGAIAAIMPKGADGARIMVTVSIGLSRIDRSLSVAEAMQATDVLLYRAKHAGRNRVEAEAPRADVRAGRRAA